MLAHLIDSPVYLFNHPEYGNRLLFKDGVTNPRDMPGKNGVTVHGWFASFFYKTVAIKATLINEKNEQEERVFYVNRNSLKKYIGAEAQNAETDQDIVAALVDKLWSNEDSKEKKEAQSEAGEVGLRHAGEHNTRLINKWSTAITDYLRGSFLSWLYQKTIGGINRIKARFFFVASEESLLEAGEVLAKKRFHEAYQDVPAYKAHIVRFNGQPVANTAFCDLPVTDKNNYIKCQQHDSDTHFNGKYPQKSKTDTSTGTTGKPTEWVRSEQELDTVKKSLKLAAKIQFGQRPLSYINAFALGPWATGLTTYELMRETGSVFATGADKEKILDKLLSIAKYEKHLLTLAVQGLDSQLSEDDTALLINTIDAALKVLLKNRDLQLDKLLNEFAERNDRLKQLFKQYPVLNIAKRLNQEKQQVIIAAYPPFLKDLTAYVQENGYNFADFSAVGIVGGQAISEAMREKLLDQGFNQIYSSYGASDLDINLGVETEYEIAVRKAIEQNPGLARELYGANKGLPMVFHYDPLNYHVESDHSNELIFTATRNDRSSPRIRYDLGDKGRVYACSDVQALLTKYGIFKKPKTNLPLMFVWGRDSTVVYNGANVAFTELERAVTDDNELDAHVLKKAFYKYEDEDGKEQFEIWLELNDNVDLPNDESSAGHAKSLLSKMAALNQDLFYQLESLDDGAELPRVRFFTRGNSPISEAHGHRKQVLIFERGVNLEDDYVFPDADKCRVHSINMSRDILHEQPAQVIGL